MKAELIVIFGNWCPECNMMMPIVDEIEAECQDILDVKRVEVADEEENLQERYGIEIVPTFIIMKNQEELGRMSGIIEKGLMVRRIQSVLENLL